MRINADWELVPDKYQWVVNHYRDGINHKTKEKTRIAHSTYHSTLSQSLQYILDQEAKTVQKVEKMQQVLETVTRQFMDALSRVDEQKIRRRIRAT